MKKWIALLLSAVLMLSLLAGCGGGNDKPNTDTPAPTPRAGTPPPPLRDSLPPTRGRHALE